MGIAERYGLIFINDEGSLSIDMISKKYRSVFGSLLCINGFHLIECEMIISEINMALHGFPYEKNFLYDWSDVNLELEYPNVIIDDLEISMKDFREILESWILFVKESKTTKDNNNKSFLFKVKSIMSKLMNKD